MMANIASLYVRMLGHTRIFSCTALRLLLNIIFIIDLCCIDAFCILRKDAFCSKKHRISLFIYYLLTYFCLPSVEHPKEKNSKKKIQGKENNHLPEPVLHHVFSGRSGEGVAFMPGVRLFIK